MPLSGHGRAGCCPVFTGCRYSLIQDRIVCKTNYDRKIYGVFELQKVEQRNEQVGKNPKSKSVLVVATVG